MKVLVVVHGYPPGAAGGTELYAEAHARTLRRVHGDEVVVLTREQDPGRDEYAVRSESRDGIRIVWINNTFRKTGSFAETYANDAIGRIADHVIDDFTPDAAHIHHLTCLSTTIVDSLARRRIPAVMTLHDYWLLCHRGQLLDTNLRVCEGPEPAGCASCLGLAGRTGVVGFTGAAVVRAIERQLPGPAAQGVRRAAETVAAMASSQTTGDEQAARRLAHMRRVCSQVSQFLAPSASIRDRFIHFGIEPERITLSPYGIDRASFAPQTPAAKTGRPLRAAFFGSLMVSKAPDILLEAVAQLPGGAVSVELFGDLQPYHGDDRYREVLKPLLARDGVTLHRSIEHGRIPEALRTIDVVVVPSIWPENSPFIIHEALAAGVPVVASRIGGIPELVEDGRNGLLFEGGNAAALAGALKRLVDEPALIDRLRGATTTLRALEDDVSAGRTLYQGSQGSHGSQGSQGSSGSQGSRGSPGSRLAAIVLNFRTPDDTLLAVKALLASDRAIDDIFVVNNAPAGSPGMMHPALAGLSPRVTILHTGGNLGFSGGMNAGIRAALARGADRVLLVNSDVIVPPDCAALLEGALAGSDRAGIAGPAMLARTDPGRIVSLGIAYSPATGRMRHHRFGALFADTPLPDALPVDAVSGCVMLVKREVFEAIGWLDEDYFFSFEDVDFCLRARRAGFQTIVAGRALVYHEGNRSIGRNTPARLYFGARNHLLLARRAGSPSTAAFTLRVAPILALNVAHAVRAGGGSLAGRLAAVARGVRDYALGRFGAGAESRRLTP